MKVDLDPKYYISPKFKQYFAESRNLPRRKIRKLNRKGIFSTGDFPEIDQGLVKIGKFIVQKLQWLQFNDVTGKMFYIKCSDILGGVHAFGILGLNDNQDAMQVSLLLMRTYNEVGIFRLKQNLPELKFELKQ